MCQVPGTIHSLCQWKNQKRTVESILAERYHAVQIKHLSLLCSLHCSLVHAISGPPAAPVLFALSSPAAGLPSLFVLISTMFAKELTSGDGSPCVFSCNADRTRPSGGLLSEDMVVFDCL